MSIDPKILKRLQGEDAFQQSQARGARRVKLDRGHNWIVRFLPAKMGPDGLWFARIAKHWVNKQPIVCPRNTGADYGGDPEAHCPVCELAAELNDSADKVISKLGYDAKASSQYLTWCVVLEKDGVAQSMAEILNPYEFWHYSSTWDELKGFYVAGGRKHPDSVLDYENGNDFSVNRTAKGTRLDKLDSLPIFDLKEKKWDEYIKKLETAMKTPKVQIPDARQLDVFAAKLQAAADRAEGNPDGADEDAPRGRGRGRVADEDDAPRGRRPAADVDDEPAPRSRRSAEPADDEPAPRRRAVPMSEDDEGHDLGPQRRAPAAEPVDDEPAPRGRRSAEPADDEPSPRRAAPVDDDEPSPRSRRSDGPADDADDAPSARRSLEPTARRASEAASAPAGADDDDQLPEDDKDSVPPADKKITVEDDDAPPAVTRRGGGQGSAVSARLQKLSTKD